MAENLSKTSVTAVPGKNKAKTAAFTRTVLRAINGDVNTRKRNLNIQKQSFKSQKQENLPINPYLPDSQKFNIFEDRTSESEAFNDENSNSAPSTKSCSSSPEYIENSPSGLKEPPFSYCKKKKERIRSDLIWNTPYRYDIYGYLREIELKFRPNPNYMAKQTDISMKMRSILVDWFIEVGEEYKMQSETLHLAVSYVDRFLSHMSVLRVKLQLVGVASMFLASKFEEIYPPELKDFVFITDNTFTKKQVLRMEHLILKVLNFDVSVPTAYAFQQLYCSMCNASESVIYLSQYICELSLVYGDPYLNFRPSTIAAGSIALANYTLGFNMWDENIAETSGYQLSDLTHVILCLYNTYSNVGGSAYQAAYEKYKKSKFGCVANVHYPPRLIFPDKSSRKLCYL